MNYVGYCRNYIHIVFVYCKKRWETRGKENGILKDDGVEWRGVVHVPWRAFDVSRPFAAKHRHTHSHCLASLCRCEVINPLWCPDKMPAWPGLLRPGDYRTGGALSWVEHPASAEGQSALLSISPVIVLSLLLPDLLARGVCSYHLVCRPCV